MKILFFAVLLSLVDAHAFTPPYNLRTIDEKSSDSIKKLAESCPMMVANEKIQHRNGRKFLGLKNVLNLCKGEAMADARGSNGGECSSCLVAPDLIITAGHCVSKETCKDKSFLFDFNNSHPNVANSNSSVELKPENLFKCKEVKAWNFDGVVQSSSKGLKPPTSAGEAPDFALVRLDRPTHRPYLGIRRSETSQSRSNKSFRSVTYPAGISAVEAHGRFLDQSDKSQKALIGSIGLGGSSGTPLIGSDGVIDCILSSSNGAIPKKDPKKKCGKWDYQNLEGYVWERTEYLCHHEDDMAIPGQKFDITEFIARCKEAKAPIYDSHRALGSFPNKSAAPEKYCQQNPPAFCNIKLVEIDPKSLSPEERRKWTIEKKPARSYCTRIMDIKDRLTPHIEASILQHNRTLLDTIETER